MTRPYRLLSTVDNMVAEAEPPVSAVIESNYIIILAALLCALICVVGLIAVARCAWLRRASIANPNQKFDNKGIKKKTIDVLPKFTYDVDRDDKSECAICLGEYVSGDEIRVLPQCGHGFHVGCVDTWLSSHSSCPSCRQVLVARRCKRCGELTANVRLGVEDKCRQHNDRSCSSDYLP